MSEIAVVYVMAEKRKAHQGGNQHSKVKKFKDASTSKPSAQTTKQQVKGAGAVKKKAFLKAKWKKKQKYIFKNAKSAETSIKTYIKTSEDTSDRTESLNQPLQSNMNSSAQKQKKRKKKKAKGLANDNKGMNQKADDIERKQHEGVASTKAWKKKKRKGTKANGKSEQKDVGQSHMVLPTEPKEVSANWKAMLSNMQKKDSKYLSKKNQEGQRQGRSQFKDKIKTKSPDVWFDDVDPELLKANDAGGSVTKATNKNQSEASSKFVVDGTEDGPTKCVALDCEMVGAGRDGKDNLLARVSIVNQNGHCLYDKFVKAREDVTDYRTWVSGVRAKDLETGEDFLTVQKEVADLLKGRILVGHALQNDMKVLFLDHPKRMIRDTFKYEPFREMFRSRRPGLKGLVEKILNVQFQKGEHNSVEDAQAVMKLYMLHRKNWESSLKMKPTKKKKTAR